MVEVIIVTMMGRQHSSCLGYVLTTIKRNQILHHCCYLSHTHTHTDTHTHISHTHISHSTLFNNDSIMQDNNTINQQLDNSCTVMYPAAHTAVM